MTFISNEAFSWNIERFNFDRVLDENGDISFQIPIIPIIIHYLLIENSFRIAVLPHLVESNIIISNRKTSM